MEDATFLYLPEGANREELGTGAYRHVHRAVRKVRSGVAGHGLVASEPIPAGAVLWTGRKGFYRSYTRAEVDAMGDPARALMLNFGYQVGEDAFEGPVDEAEVEDDVSSFWNHSCDPNSVVDGLERWVARRDIAPGEELSADYGTFDASLDRIAECRCGAAECRGAVRPDDYLRPDLRARYGRHFMPYLLARMDAE